MPTEFDNMHYGVSNGGYVLLNTNQDYSNDKVVLDLIIQYKKVVFGDNFNMPIDYLPKVVTHLWLGRKFNQPINNLPQSLKQLIISSNEISYCEFNQPLDNLPEGLETISIILNKSFNHPIDNLPNTLKKFSMSCKAFKQSINSLPGNLEELVIQTFDFENTYYLPSSLKSFHITGLLANDHDMNIIQGNLIDKYPDIPITLNYQ